MKKNSKKILAAGLMILALASAFIGGYFTHRYLSWLEWREFYTVIREGGSQEYIDGGKLILKQTPPPESEVPERGLKPNPPGE